MRLPIHHIYKLCFRHKNKILNLGIKIHATSYILHIYITVILRYTFNVQFFMFVNLI